jgi:hypothetical protein
MRRFFCAGAAERQFGTDERSLFPTLYQQGMFILLEVVDFSVFAMDWRPAGHISSMIPGICREQATIP